MKKRGIKILSAALVIILIMSMATAVLAEDDGEGQQDGQNRTQTLLFTKYAPELLDDYLAAKEEHANFHADRKAEHEALKEQIRAELTSIIDALIDGEMTGEQAKRAIIFIRDSLAGMRDEIAPIRDAKQAENDPIKAERESLRARIKAAIEAETVDEDLVASLLEQGLSLLKQHLAIDCKYAAQVDAAKSKYFPG